MLTTMATALLNAIPGESPETRLAAFAERLGAVYEGSCWRMSPAVRETLRDAAVALALEPPEPVDDATDPGWEAVVLEAEARRQARTAERVTARFSRSCRGAGRQALFDGQGAMLAQLVAADLPVTPETLAWAASLEDLSVLPVEAPVDLLAVEGARAWTTHVVAQGLRGRSRRAALEEVPLELSIPVAGVAVSAPTATELLQGLTPEVHRRAAIKRSLVGLWRTHLAGDWPATCPEGRWERLAWLAFVGYALPPVFPDQRRWDARSTLGTELQGSGLELGQVRATLEVARKFVLAEAGERHARPARAQ
ncbi:MAG: hypothetical protein ACRELA_02265 [Candidatus Rokuibacteriota bacterium]